MRFTGNSVRVMVRRRPVINSNPAGNGRGEFIDNFETWAGWRAAGARDLVEAGVVQDAIDIVIRIHDTDRNRTITIADRIVLKNQEYAIASVGQPDRTGGFIEIMLQRHVAG